MFRIIKTKISRIALFDIITISDIVFGILALVSLLYFFARPIKFADIKVPVATDKSSYYAGQEVSGIFFGETFYDGNVKILREVFCTNYKGVIKPPAESADGNFFNSIGKPRKFDGNTIRIGKLPDDVPTGQNCVIRFTNLYTIQTPFGTRHEEYQYYTQNFAIITKERREQLDCEASGKSTEECQNSTASTDVQQNTSTDNTFGGVSLEGGEDGTNTETNSANSQNSNSNTTSPPETNQNEPVTAPQECRINILGFIKFGCQ